MGLITTSQHYMLSFHVNTSRHYAPCLFVERNHDKEFVFRRGPHSGLFVFLHKHHLRFGAMTTRGINVNHSVFAKISFARRKAK